MAFEFFTAHWIVNGGKNGVIPPSVVGRESVAERFQQRVGVGNDLAIVMVPLGHLAPVRALDPDS